MDDAQPTMLLTRPEQQSRAFLAQCEALVKQRIPVVISPLMRIDAVGNLPDLTAYKTLIVTSGNGVDRLGSAIMGRRVVTVGESTAEKARALGADAIALGENVEGFLKNAGDIEGPALYCRGVHTRGNLAEALRENGLDVEECILYHQAAEDLSQAARALLASPVRVIAPLFSPRTAALLGRYEAVADLTLVMISPATAAAWTGGGTAIIAPHPDAASVASAVAQAF